MAGAVEAVFKNKKVLALLKDLTKKTEQFEKKDKVVVDLLSAVVFKDIMDHFEQQRGPESSWAPWSRGYANRLARLGKAGNRILQDTGRLRNSFLPGNNRVVNQGILWFNPAKTSKGFPYARLHDEGGSIHPQREFMWLSAKAMGNLETQIVKFLDS